MDISEVLYQASGILALPFERNFQPNYYTELAKVFHLPKIKYKL